MVLLIVIVSFQNMPKLVVDSLILMEVCLVFFLYQMVSSLLALLRTIKSFHHLAAVVATYEPKDIVDSKRNISLISLLHLYKKISPVGFIADAQLVVSLGLECNAPHADEAEKLINKIANSDITSSSAAERDVKALNSLLVLFESGEVQVDKSATTGNKEIVSKKGKKKLKAVSANSSAEVAIKVEPIIVDKKRLTRLLRKRARIATQKFCLDLILFLLNVIAGVGYLMGIVAFYFPTGSSEWWVQFLLLYLTPAEADWYGNFAGDFAWTVEPFLIICSSWMVK